MHAVSDTPAKRDFSGFAILRGSLAAVVTAYLISVVTLASLDAWFNAAMAYRDELDFGQVLIRMPEFLTYAFESIPVIATLPLLSLIAVIGLFVLKAHRNRMQYRAALSAGSITAALLVALPLVVLMLSGPGASFNIVPGLLICGVLPVAIGGVAGLVGRFAAGAPRVVSQAERKPVVG